MTDPIEPADAPLVAAVRAARARLRLTMQIPGHKYRYRTDSADALGADLLQDLLRDDVALQGGADDNSYSGGYLTAAERLWAAAVGADHSRFLVGGGSQGNLAAMLTISREGELIAVDRTSHRSALAGLVLSGATPFWVFPEVHPEFGLPIGLRPAALTEVPKVSALFATSPGYVGTISDVSALANWAHERDTLLAVDQAWGAHLDFGIEGYSSALTAGADIAVTSIHKALLGYSQTAVVSMSVDRLSPERLDRSVDLTATTSPSATLLASIDATRAVLERDGGAAFERAIAGANWARMRLERIPGLVVLTDEIAGWPVDPLKLVLWLPRTGCTGTELAAALWQDGIGVESADLDTLVMTVTVGDDQAALTPMVELVTTHIETRRRQSRPATPSDIWQIRPDVVMTPRVAMFADRRRLTLSDAIGEISAEQFCPYPPGVPLLGPGERVSREVVEAIQLAGKHCRVAYCSDPSLATIEVVA